MGCSDYWDERRARNEAARKLEKPTDDFWIVFEAYGYEIYQQAKNCEEKNRCHENCHPGEHVAKVVARERKIVRDLILRLVEHVKIISGGDVDSCSFEPKNECQKHDHHLLSEAERWICGW